MLEILREQLEVFSEKCVFKSKCRPEFQSKCVIYGHYWCKKTDEVMPDPKISFEDDHDSPWSIMSNNNKHWVNPSD